MRSLNTRRACAPLSGQGRPTRKRIANGSSSSGSSSTGRGRSSHSQKGPEQVSIKLSKSHKDHRPDELVVLTARVNKSSRQNRWRANGHTASMGHLQLITFPPTPIPARIQQPCKERHSPWQLDRNHNGIDEVDRSIYIKPRHASTIIEHQLDFLEH